MKKLALLILTVVLLLGLITITSYSALFGSKQHVMKLAETHPKDYPTEKADEYFAKLVNERTKNKIKIDVYFGSQLGEEKVAIEQVQFGAIDFTRVSCAVMASFYKPLNALQLPYLYRSEDHMWKVLNGPIGESLLTGLESAKFVGLCYYDGGERNFYTKKLVTKVADLKGMKIRVQQTDLFVNLIKYLGAVPQPLPYGEVFSALQTGVVDGAENNFPSYDTQNHYQVAKFYLLDGHSRVPEILFRKQNCF